MPIMENIVFEKLDSVAVIRLNRPQVFNSFDRQMALELQKTLDDCEADESIRCIFLTGNGKAFCAGQDLQEISDPKNGPPLSTILLEHYNPIVSRIRKIEKPIVCAVNGVAAGAGANIALACDVTVAADSASFIQAFSKIGLIPDSGGTYTLPRLVGWQKASALMMLGDKVTATEAERIGMIYRVFPDENFMEEAMKIAVTLSQMPTKALGYIKRALNKSLTNNLREQLELENELQTASSETHDYKEGVAAFLEKRRAEFRGR